MTTLRARLLELPQYFLVSCCALATDTGVLLLLNSVFKVPYLLAATTSFIAGGGVSYVLSVRLVWKTDQAASRSFEVTLFILLGLVGLGINAVIMLAVVSGLDAPVIVAKGVAAGFTFICNYYLRRRWVFPGATRRMVSWLPETGK
jgi:putative flippase GtrA